MASGAGMGRGTRGARKHAFHFEHDGHEVRGFVKELDDDESAIRRAA